MNRDEKLATLILLKCVTKEKAVLYWLKDKHQFSLEESEIIKKWFIEQLEDLDFQPDFVDMINDYQIATDKGDE